MDSDQKLNAYMFSKNEFCITDFSKDHVYSDYDLLQE